MGKVRIIGGGLTGVLAAFEAHRQGYRDIELHERFEALGGAALPRQSHGIEARDTLIRFGPKGDPVRDLLEANGLAFQDFDARCGSVSPTGDGGRRWTEGFDGPVLPAEVVRTDAAGLEASLSASPPQAAQPLGAYLRWRLGAQAGAAHTGAAGDLGLDRALPAGAAFDAPLRRASLPRDGFRRFFAEARGRLESLGVHVHDGSLVAPRHAFLETLPGDVLVWAADPGPLFPASGLPAPRPVGRLTATYVFRAYWAGHTPFHAQSFLASGACFRASFYESGGQTLLAAECVREACDAEIRYELRGLLAGFCGGETLRLGEQVAQAVGPRAFLSVELAEGLKGLGAMLGRHMAGSFVPGAWEAHAGADKLAGIGAGLAAARQAAERPRLVAAE